MRVIVDASVAIKWFVNEDLHQEALRLLAFDDALRAPDFILAEVGNVFWRKRLSDDLEEALALRALDELRKNLPVLYPLSDLVERAFRIATHLRHPIYDCIYLACAEAAQGVLVSADRRLLRIVGGTQFAPLVRDLRDFQVQ